VSKQDSNVLHAITEACMSGAFITGFVVSWNKKKQTVQFDG
jgi:hypothetical protein